MNKWLTCLIALVWLVNGLVCKVLHAVPRHREIVANILGNSHAALFTTLIGFAEMCMTVWIISGYLPRLNAIAQVAIIATMNILEFTLVPHLLLWGRFNMVFALLFCALILYNEFYLRNNPTQQS